MILRHGFKSWRVTFALVKVETTTGLNSLLPDGNHVLAWDFDDVPYRKVAKSLRRLQRSMKLPNIYVTHSSRGNRWHALCLHRTAWRETILVALNTPEVDDQWIRGGIIRKYFTLRVGPKKGRVPKAYSILRSNVPETVRITEVVNGDRYETISR